MTLNGWHAGHVAALLLGFSLTSSAQAPAPQNDPRVGTWKLNLEKSRYPAGTAPRMQVRRIDTRPDGFSVFTLSGQDYQGNPMFIQSVYKFDGKEYPEYNQTNLAEFAARARHRTSRAYTNLWMGTRSRSREETPPEKSRESTHRPFLKMATR